MYTVAADFVGGKRMSSPAPMDVDWASAGDLTELLTHLSLDKYTSSSRSKRYMEIMTLKSQYMYNHTLTMLSSSQIDMATFLTLTDQDLRELGITTFGARRKMLLAIDGAPRDVTIASLFNCVSTSRD